jgi:hypothetical protein
VIFANYSRRSSHLGNEVGPEWAQVRRTAESRCASPVTRPGRLELPTLCLEAVRTTLPNLARGVANRADSASWGKFPQPAFSFLHCCLPPFCLRFPHFALHFRDSRRYQPNTVEGICLLASVTRIRARLRFPSTSTECNRVKSRQNPHPLTSQIWLGITSANARDSGQKKLRSVQHY